jgi:hypothetical protein
MTVQEALEVRKWTDSEREKAMEKLRSRSGTGDYMFEDFLVIATDGFPPEY